MNKHSRFSPTGHGHNFLLSLQTFHFDAVTRMPSDRTKFSTAVQRVTAGQYWQQSWCEPVSTLCSNVSVFIVSPLIFRWRHQSCNLGGKPVIFSFPLCSLSFISNVSRTRKVVAVQTPCLGLWLYCQRAASLHDVKWQLLCVCFVYFTPSVTAPLRSTWLCSLSRDAARLWFIWCRVGTF